MNSFGIETSETEGVAVFAVEGYFDDRAGKSLRELVEQALTGGKTRMVIDFSRCQVINSMGVAAMLDMSLRVVDECQGTMVLTGLDQLKQTVFKLAGVIPLVASAAATLPEAIRAAQA